MASLGDGGFDAAAPENQKTSSVVPAGEYPAIMIESEKVATKASDGHYLKTQWQIVKGEFQNRRIFCNFNLWLNPSKELAIQIGKGQFSECCRAVNVLNPKDSSELHNKVCIVKLKIVKDDQYGDKNEITKFAPVGKQAAPAEQLQAASASTSDANPWG